MAKTTKNELFEEFELKDKVEAALRFEREARKSKRFGEMKLVLGKTGVGKTMAAKAYMAKDQDAVYVRCRRGMRKNRFMKALAEALGIKKKMTYDDYVDEIAFHLQGTKTLLVIDETEHITIETVEGVRYISDMAGVGAIFIALPEFLNYIKGHRRDYEYIYNRLGVTYLVRNPKVKDFEKMIEGVLPVRYAGILHELSGENARFLRTIVRNSILYALENEISYEDDKKMEDIFRKAADELDVKNRMK